MVRIQSHDAHQLELLQFQAVRRNRVQIVGAQATRRRQAQLAQSAAILQQHLEALAGQQLLAQATSNQSLYIKFSTSLQVLAHHQPMSISANCAQLANAAMPNAVRPCVFHRSIETSRGQLVPSCQATSFMLVLERCCAAITHGDMLLCMFLYVCKTKSYPNSNALAVDSA